MRTKTLCGLIALLLAAAIMLVMILGAAFGAPAKELFGIATALTC
jgi:hypothetical protein